MRLKTSNKILLGYVASLMLIMGATIIFGSTKAENLPGHRFTDDAEYQSEAIDAFSVLYISGNSNVRLGSGESFEIQRVYYPNGNGSVNIDYYIKNDTCFVSRWERNGMNSAILNVGQIDEVIVENSATLYIEKFVQDKLTATIRSSKMEVNHKSFMVSQLELTASERSNIMLYGVGHLQLLSENSKVQVFEYLESVSGEIHDGTRLEFHKSAGKLDLEKSKDSKILMY